jgi:amidophosphoribosyltransferase
MVRPCHCADGMESRHVLIQSDYVSTPLEYSDVKAGEAIFIDMEGNCHSRMCHVEQLSPCIFEYVYFARPDSIMDGVSVYETRLKMGEKLAQKILRVRPDHDIDVVIPIPDTSRTSALQAA